MNHALTLMTLARHSSEESSLTEYCSASSKFWSRDQTLLLRRPIGGSSPTRADAEALRLRSGAPEISETNVRLIDFGST